MVGGVVHSVHTDGVDAQLLELLDIALAAVDVGNGILCIGGAAGLVVNTADVEALVAGPEGYEWCQWCFWRTLGSNRVPLPLTVTWGTLPELVPEALASSLAGVAAAVARAAEAAAIAIAPFMVVRNEDMSALLAIGLVDTGGCPGRGKSWIGGYPKRKGVQESDYEG